MGGSSHCSVHLSPNSDLLLLLCASMTTSALSNKQLARFGQLWSAWHTTHAMAGQALSLAVNIHGRLQADPAAFPLAAQQPSSSDATQQLLVSKQLASMDRALSSVRGCHEQLQQVVRDMERLYIEASGCLHSLAGSTLAAAAVPQGPEPSLLQLVEAMQDTWVMCRDELLLKVAILGLVSLSATPQHMATLLQCYGGQPNIRRDKVDAVLRLLQETRLQQDQ